MSQALMGVYNRAPVEVDRGDVAVDVRGKGLLIGVKLVVNHRDMMATERTWRVGRRWRGKLHPSLAAADYHRTRSRRRA